NGGEIERTNSYAGMKDRGGDITPVFEGGSLHAIEVRTYSIDRVETFEKNMLFHTYATMGIQAVEKFTRFQGVVFKKALEQ
ncbi:MAG: hypothetical protein LBH96_00035, partial [Candidatus Peribacteria bacterium]|nr:hypothetical protein [Candidatus Peribacteria bacterium]